MPVTNKPMSWSFSVLEAYETCPLQLKETRLTKRFSDQNKFNVFGNIDHFAFENRLVKGTPLPPQLAPYEEAVQRISEIPGESRCELELCVTSNWLPTGWYSKDAWARAKIDLSIFDRNTQTVSQFDWKFGKYRKNSRWLQLKINNLLFDSISKAQGFTVEQFNNALVWVVDGFDIEPFKLKQEQMDDVRCEVLEKVEVYAEAYEKDHFPPKQSGLCRKHCPVLSCKFNGRNS